MHFEILIEDQSGKKFLDILLPRIIDGDHSFRVHPYKGIGRIPKNIAGKTDPSKRILLDRLPKILSGYGDAFEKYPDNYDAVVIVVCDLDNKVRSSFENELTEILAQCTAKPEAYFCFAVEEGEAWFLGDIPAIKKEFPKARDHIFQDYVPDSICGTWECLADAVFPGGAQALSKKGWQAIGAEKSSWSERITPHMTIADNRSPSFCAFRDKILSLLHR